MKNTKINILAIAAITIFSVNAYYDHDDYRPHTVPGRAVEATGNVVEGTGKAAGTVVEGTGKVAGNIVEETGSFLGGIFTGKNREERRQEREEKRREKQEKRASRNR